MKILTTEMWGCGGWGSEGRADQDLVSYLVAVRMTTNHNGVRPPGNEFWNVLTDDRFSEDRASQNVSDGPIGTQPHLLQFEL